MAFQTKKLGIGVSPGIALAGAFIYRPNTIEPPLYLLEEDEVEAEWDRFISAKDMTRRQLRDLRDDFDLEAANGEAGIIDAHLLVLDDEMIVEDVRSEIFEHRHNSEWAVRDVANRYISKFNGFDDIFFRERAGDIADVSRRVLRALMGINDDLSFSIDEPIIVVAENLTPSEALGLPKNLVAGVALDRGSMTSHAALLIRALGIPAVFGLNGFSSSVKPGELIGIDGNKGLVFVNPSDEDADYLRAKALQREDALKEFKLKCREVCATPDGFAVKCLANIENLKDLEVATENGADGVGLFRTEYLWLDAGKRVSEEAQQAVYTELANEMGDKPFVIRVFDLGGDKFLAGLGLREKETNPFLGLRSIRFLLQHEEIFKEQLRAILSASATTHKQVHLLFPMISDLSEIVRSKKLVEESMLELEERGVKGLIFPKIGMMIEIPSAALLSYIYAKHVDFFSIGTNDLTQYTMAADRINDTVAYLYQPLHPAVLKLIAMASEASSNAKIGLCVCGEMAGNPLHVPILLGFHVQNLSMAASSVPIVKELIRKIPLCEAEKLATAALNVSTMAQVRHLSRDLLARFAPEILKQC